MPDISSTANPRVRQWTDLRKRRSRDARGQFLIEGRREVERGGEHFELVELIWCEAYAGTAPTGATTVSRRVFDRLSRRQHPDGVAGVATTPDLSLDRLKLGTDPLVLVADGIEKSGNIGAIIRTCDAFGASFVGSSLQTDLVNPNVIRAAQGSLFATPLATGDRREVMAWAAASSRVLVTRPDATRRLWDADMTGPLSIVVGAEHAGADPAWDRIGEAVRIPMAGSADSLNTSVTAGIVLAEAARQRSG